MSRFDALAATWDDDPAKVERAEAAARSLRERIPLAGSGWSALELGSGTGLLSRALAVDLGPITLVDTSEQMTLLAAERVAAATEAHVTGCCIDLTTEAPPTAPYEVAYSLLALHHMDDVEAVLRALHDLLVPGGWVALLDLDHDADGSFHRVPHHHEAGAHRHHDHEDEPHGHEETIDHVHDGFTHETLARLLEETGFTAIEVSDAGFAVEKGEPPRSYPMVRAVARRTEQPV